MHIITLSFDDGFLKSNTAIARIYEKFHLSACFNIIASGHLPDFVPPDPGHVTARGDCGLWNELQARGHEIMPHGYRHANKKRITFQESKDLSLRCLDVFQKSLKGFNPRKAVYNFPYNASTPELEAWLPTVVRAFRTGGGGINPMPHAGQVKLTTTGFGPANCEEHLDQEIAKLLERPHGWLLYNTHGLDDESWGPIGSAYLERLLERLVAIPTVRVLPAGKALSQGGN